MPADTADTKQKPKTFMLRRMPPQLHKAIRIEAAKRELSMEDAIYELLAEVLLRKKKGG